jgi:hypothetical protein
MSAPSPAAAPPAPLCLALPGMDGNGSPIYSVLHKRTYDITPDQALVRAAKDAPFTAVETFHDNGDAESSTVRLESEMTTFKARTDVVFIGKAYAPGGQPVQAMDAGIQVDGAGRKLLRIFGDRKCTYRLGYSPAFSEPAPFTEMELRYERAFGGKDLHSLPGIPFHYPRNPMGKGFAIRNMKEAVHNLPLPNIEDPQDLITPERLNPEEPEGWRLLPMPAGLGWYQKTWYPRSFSAGSLPPFLPPGTLTREEHLGLVPKDHIALALRHKLAPFHSRFNNGASPGLAFPYLKGDETVRLKGLTPEGQLLFRLPGETPALSLDIGLPRRDLDIALITVLIRMEEKQVDLIWSGSRPYPGMDWLPEMKTLRMEAA